ncbi:MAG: methylated-DNA-[protein]-cysteine S-methyltransferase [Fimbriimonadaceae bacterium]|jgi:methylated-DNA-[protein]-cysteine S-methyltransferase|nr:methylated-DNA-[protein]-cysteine S-methyltransferase [Fimbriimonadaceae bacterium]
MTYFTIFDSPIGQLLLTSDGASITRLFMEDYEGGPTASSDFLGTNGHARFGSLPHADWQDGAALPMIRKAKDQIDEFFAGNRHDFDLPLKPEGTEFQRTVWDELTRIPFGKTISYGELARRIGKREASRAVGLANGRNPISIIVPCHRVIGASGRLTGYGGGIDRKEWLLGHEATVLGNRQPELAL